MITTIENSRIHQRKLRLLFNETNTTFNELITTDKSVTLHDATLPGVVTEMLIVKKGLSAIRIQNQLSENKHLAI